MILDPSHTKLCPQFFIFHVKYLKALIDKPFAVTNFNLGIGMLVWLWDLGHKEILDPISSRQGFWEIASVIWPSLIWTWQRSATDLEVFQRVGWGSFYLLDVKNLLDWLPIDLMAQSGQVDILHLASSSNFAWYMSKQGVAWRADNCLRNVVAALHRLLHFPNACESRDKRPKWPFGGPIIIAHLVERLVLILA